MTLAPSLRLSAPLAALLAVPPLAVLPDVTQLEVLTPPHNATGTGSASEFEIFLKINLNFNNWTSTKTFQHIQVVST